MIETLLIAHASFLTHPVPMAQMGLVRLEVLFFFVIVQELCVLRQIHGFLSVVLFLMKVVSEVYHLHLQKHWHDLDEQEVYRHHLRPVLL